MPRWLKRTAVVSAAALVLAGGAVGYLLLSDTTSPVDVGEAVDRYRQERSPGPRATPTTARTRAGLPAEGVYVYATEGEERIDILGGSTHRYPGQTTVTIRHTGCGVEQRWAPLGERWDEEEICQSDEGRERRALRTHHEFFGIADDQDFRCEAGYVLFPDRAVEGDRWSTSCRSGDTELTGAAEVVGLEVRAVGGVDVETVHVRVTEQAGGSSTGPSSDDYWWRTADGLLIERSSTVDTRSDSPVGTAHYTERFSLRLVSITPHT